MMLLVNFFATVIARRLDGGNLGNVIEVGLTFVLVSFLCFIPATILAILLANIPLKKLSYGDRVTLWIGFIMLAFMVLFSCLLCLIIFGLGN